MRLRDLPSVDELLRDERLTAEPRELVLAAARRAGVPVIGAGSDGRSAYEPYRVTVNGQLIAVIGATQVLVDHLIGAWSAGPGDPGLASAKNAPRA